MPDDIGVDVEAWAGPMESLELALAQFAGDDDGRKQGEAHADADALLHGFDAGELGDVTGTHVLKRKRAVELGAIAAPGFGEQERLAGEIGGLDGAAIGERMAGIAEEIDPFSADEQGAVRGGGGSVAHVDDEIELARLEFGCDGVVEMGTEGDFDVGKAAAKDAKH